MGTRPSLRAPTYDELALLGEVAAALDPDDLSRSLGQALEILRAGTGAADAELFLSDPDSGRLVLTACEGGDRLDLMERTIFELGEGHPGMTSVRRRPLATRDLPHDRRYVRAAVKRSGIRAYLSVPVLDRERVLGSLHLAWRDADAPVNWATRVLARAARPLATTLRAAFAALEDAARQEGLPDPARLGRALAAALPDPWRRFELHAASAALPPGTTPCALRLEACPCVASSRPVLLDRSTPDWPAACAPADGHARCCVPLPGHDAGPALLMVDYGPSLPSPPTRDLVPLRILARAVSAHLLPAPRAAALSPHEAPPALELRCLGPFEVRRGGVRLPASAFSRRGALTLLKLLVLQGRRPISQHEICERLWPEADPAAATNRLHGFVHALRAAIEPALSNRRWTYLQNHGDRYVLDLQGVEVDVLRFRHQLERARRAAPGPARAAELEQATALYRGDLFADDLLSELWEEERRELRERQLQALAQLARAHQEAGAGARAVEALRGALKLDPLREDLHRELVGALLALGRRAEALEQYRVCVRVLRQELDADPQAETSRLGRALATALGKPAPLPVSRR